MIFYNRFINVGHVDNEMLIKSCGYFSLTVGHPVQWTRLPSHSVDVGLQNTKCVGLGLFHH